MVVVVVGGPPDPTGQQHAALPLMVQDQGQQRHHQDEDDSAADDRVGDAGVVTQPVVQGYKVLTWSLWRREYMDLFNVGLALRGKMILQLFSREPMQSSGALCLR